MTFLCLVDRKNWEGREVRRVHRESLCVHRLNFLMTFSLKVLAAKCCLLLPSELPALIKVTCLEVIYLQSCSPVTTPGWGGGARGAVPGAAGTPPARSGTGQSCGRVRSGRTSNVLQSWQGPATNRPPCKCSEVTEVSPQQPAGSWGCSTSQLCSRLCQKCPPVSLRAAPPGAPASLPDIIVWYYKCYYLHYSKHSKPQGNRRPFHQATNQCRSRSQPSLWRCVNPRLEEEHGLNRR